MARRGPAGAEEVFPSYAPNSVFGIAAVEIAGAVVFVMWSGAAAELAFAPEVTLARNVVHLDPDAVRVLE